MNDPHADRRDQQRRKAAQGHQTTNPGLRIVQRSLAAKAQGTPKGATTMLTRQKPFPLVAIGITDTPADPTIYVLLSDKKDRRRAAILAVPGVKEAVPGDPYQRVWVPLSYAAEADVVAALTSLSKGATK